MKQLSANGWQTGSIKNNRLDGM